MYFFTCKKKLPIIFFENKNTDVGMVTEAGNYSFSYENAYLSTFRKYKNLLSNDVQFRIKIGNV